MKLLLKVDCIKHYLDFVDNHVTEKAFLDVCIFFNAQLEVSTRECCL